MKTLYISDLDGTLFNEKAQVDEAQAAKLNVLIERGVLFTYATARSPNSASPKTSAIKFNLPAITFNGVFLSRGQEIIEYERFAPCDIEKLKEIYRPHCPLTYSFIDGVQRVSYLENTANVGHRAYIRNRPNDSRMRPCPMAHIFDGEIFYFTLISSTKSPLTPILEAVAPYSESLICREVDRREFWLESRPKTAGKELRALQLKKMTGADRLVVFGDNHNDAAMFAVADLKFAAKNAVRNLKAQADGIFTTVADTIAELESITL